MFLSQIFILLLRLSPLWYVSCSLLVETESKMMEDISRDWSKSVELIRRHLDQTNQAYKQLNNITEYYNYPLEAVRRGYIELLQVMLDNGLPIDTRYENIKDNVLHEAAEYGQYNVVKFLIQRGADVNGRNYFKTTPLHWAAMRGHVNIVSLLLDSGADINASDEKGYTPLHWAARKGYEPIVVVLVHKGCDTTKRNFWGQTASDIAKTQKIKNIILKMQVTRQT